MTFLIYKGLGGSIQVDDIISRCDSSVFKLDGRTFGNFCSHANQFLINLQQLVSFFNCLICFEQGNGKVLVKIWAKWVKAVSPCV